MTTKFINTVTYQGYPCKAVQWRRTEGLHPENGFVIIDYSVLKELKLQSLAVPWRGDDGGADGPGGLSIAQWWKVKGNRTRTSDKPFTPVAGLALFGPLVMTSQEVGGASESVQYDDVYVLNGAEVSENIARVLEHKFGEVRVDLTDIRQFYGKIGDFSGRINCRMKNGRYDPRTVKTPGRGPRRAGTTTTAELDGTPWSFQEVVRFFFSELPGGPSVSFAGLPSMPPPEEIDHVSSKVGAILQGILDNYGCIAKMLPNGTYFVCKRNAPNWVAPGEIAPAVGEKRKADHIVYEIKTVSRVDTPAVVKVHGGRRYRQETMGYVPVFRDRDGRVYLLNDIGKVYDGYDIGKVNAQAARSSSSNFQDVTPKPFKKQISTAALKTLIATGQGLRGTAEGLSDDELHYARRNILRDQAYRMYAPIALFTNAPTNGFGAPYFSDLDDRVFPFLPVGPVPVFEKDLDPKLARAALRGADRIRGDRGRIVLAPPIVRGTVLTEALYTNADEIARRWNAVIARWKREQERVDLAFQVMDERRRGIKNQNLEADARIAVGQFVETGLLAKLGDQFETGLARRFIMHGAAMAEMANDEGTMLKIRLEALQEYRVTIPRIIAELVRNRAEDFAALAVHGGVRGVGQQPHGVIPDSAYSIESATGILTFSQLCATVNHPLVFSQEDLIVEGDGMVSVTYGWPVDFNEPSDYTSILFMKDGRGGAKVCGANRSSGVKPFVVRDPDLVMYENEKAEPMNLKDCIDQAEKKARPVLEGQDSTEGHVTTISPFVPCVLERGINSVQYVFPALSAEGGTAHTFVAVHSARWDGPAGAAQVTRLPDNDGPARTAAKQVAG